MPTYITTVHPVHIICVHLELKVTNLATDCRTRLTVHAVQLMPQKPYRAHESHTTLSLDPEQNESMVLPIVVSFLKLCMMLTLLCNLLGWACTRSMSDSVLV